MCKNRFPEVRQQSESPGVRRVQRNDVVSESKEHLALGDKLILVSLKAAIETMGVEFVETRIEYLKSLGELTEEEYGIMLLKTQQHG